ncbi:MAG: MBL fold metallo-hydrolase [Spirochaetes bacterium]|jgi:glyoxylase-like metal-dependent hydrolase (beta-lactamase superfamily II)|nr:MBL fold metallo-hydrolase [Spirochaetota bacterium]
MKIVTFENGPFLVNTYLVVNEEVGKSFIIDPGSDIGPLIDRIAHNGFTLDAIVNTHGHIDHVAGVNLVKKRFNVPFYMNAGDEDLLGAVSMQARMFGVADPGPVAVDEKLPESGIISVAGIEITLLHTPGHSKGSLSLLMGDVVFSGDALFNFSIGRTDLPGGDYAMLIDSIREKLFSLPDTTKVLCGHGPETDIGTEKRLNPFFN